MIQRIKILKVCDSKRFSLLHHFVSRFTLSISTQITQIPVWSLKDTFSVDSLFIVDFRLLRPTIFISSIRLDVWRHVLQRFVRVRDDSILACYSRVVHLTLYQLTRWAVDLLANSVLAHCLLWELDIDLENLISTDSEFRQTSWYDCNRMRNAITNVSWICHEIRLLHTNMLKEINIHKHKV